MFPRHRRINDVYLEDDATAAHEHPHQQQQRTHHHHSHHHHHRRHNDAAAAGPEDANVIMSGDAHVNKPEPRFMSGPARWVLVVLFTGLLSLFYYVSTGPDGYPNVESTSGLSATHVLGRAARKALNGGVAGFMAGLAQVLLFMWMRTVMNYQYAHGGTAMNAFRQLYADGGLPRFYQGLTFAIIQAPLARFGDVAFNTAILALFDEWASAFGAGWRIFISPVDTLKTALQVNGREALALLTARRWCEVNSVDP